MPARRSTLPLLLPSLMGAALAAHAFPEAATAPPAAELQAALAGKVFRATLANGNGWRVEYKSGGYAFVDTTTGFSDSGAWTTEDGRLCVSWRKGRPGCIEARLVGPRVYLRRDNGEIVELTPQ